MNLYAKWQPKLLIGDADGLGYPIMCSLKNTLENVVLFRGAMQAVSETNGNARADGYMATKEMLECNFLRLNDNNSARQLEYMKIKYRPQSGSVLIMDKKEIRKEQGESPDYADALMMAIYGIYFHPRYFISNYGRADYSNFKLETDFDIYD